MADHQTAIDLAEALVGREGWRELRNDLATAYNNRGNTAWQSGELTAAIADYARAISIREELVHREGRREVRNDRAMVYNNRGTARTRAGELATAVSDYDAAIELRTKLLAEEPAAPRYPLAMVYNNRGNAHQWAGNLEASITDWESAISIVEILVEQDRRSELVPLLADLRSRRAAVLRAMTPISSSTSPAAHRPGPVPTEGLEHARIGSSSRRGRVGFWRILTRLVRLGH